MMGTVFVTRNAYKKWIKYLKKDKNLIFWVEVIFLNKLYLLNHFILLRLPNGMNMTQTSSLLEFPKEWDLKPTKIWMAIVM